MVGSRYSAIRVSQFCNGIPLYGAKSKVWTTSRESQMLCLSFKRWAKRKKKHGSIIVPSIRCVGAQNISLTIVIRRVESALVLLIGEMSPSSGNGASLHTWRFHQDHQKKQSRWTHLSVWDGQLKSTCVLALLSRIPSGRAERDIWEIPRVASLFSSASFSYKSQSILL
jgi:hypothetical protein